MKPKVHGYFVTYRWELWLIVGIPAITYVLHFVFAVTTAYILGGGNSLFKLYELLGGVAHLLLLAVSYLRVRKLGRDFLAVVWGYFLAVSVIPVTAQGILFLVEVAGNQGLMGQLGDVILLALPVKIAVLLWFARSASRLSLAHAVFLLIFSSSITVGSVTGSPVSGRGTLLIGAAFGLTVVFVKVWLLGNFEQRDSRFRRDAVIGLLATLMLSGYAKPAIAHFFGYTEGPYVLRMPLLGAGYGSLAFFVNSAFALAFLAVFFALVYSARVRPPAAVTEPEATPATPDEER